VPAPPIPASMQPRFWAPQATHRLLLEASKILGGSAAVCAALPGGGNTPGPAVGRPAPASPLTVASSDAPTRSQPHGGVAVCRLKKRPQTVRNVRLISSKLYAENATMPRRFAFPAGWPCKLELEIPSPS